MADLAPDQQNCSSPNCAKPIPDWYRASYLSTSVRRPVFVSVIGDLGHGKTIFLTMLVSLLRSKMPGLWQDFSCRQLQTSPAFEENMRLIGESYLPKPTRASFPAPVVYELKGMPHYGNRIVLLYDPPGEALNNPEKFGRFAAFVRNSDCILLLVSLTQLRDSGTIADIGENLSNLIERFIEGLDSQGVQPQQQHCVIVYTKADQLDDIGLPEAAMTYVGGAEAYGVDMNTYLPNLDQQSQLLKKFTNDILKASNFLKLARGYFRSVHFVATSSLGGEPDQSRLITREPHRVLDPLIWTLELTKHMDAERQRTVLSANVQRTLQGIRRHAWQTSGIVLVAVIIMIAVLVRPNFVRGGTMITLVPTATNVPPSVTVAPAANVAPIAVAPTPLTSGPSRIQIQDVNLRKEPSPESKILGVIYRGVKVLVLNEVQFFEQSVWVKVQYANQVGWVNYRFLKPVGPEDEQLRRARVVTTGTIPLLIRPEPKKSDDRIDQVTNGNEVILLDGRQESDGIIWQRVQIDENKGWANAEFLQELP